MIGMTEAVVVGGVLVLVFGASQIPKLARSVGEGLKELKLSVREAKEVEPSPEVSPNDAPVET
jgi:TatA/E family protein of Tat protein translocase